MVSLGTRILFYHLPRVKTIYRHRHGNASTGIVIYGCEVQLLTLSQKRDNALPNSEPSRAVRSRVESHIPSVGMMYLIRCLSCLKWITDCEPVECAVISLGIESIMFDFGIKDTLIVFESFLLEKYS